MRYLLIDAVEDKVLRSVLAALAWSSESDVPVLLQVESDVEWLVTAAFSGATVETLRQLREDIE